MRPGVRCAQRHRGTGLTELVILIPLLLVMLGGATDLCRMIYARQTLADLTRETANLVSRGASTEQAFAALSWANDTVDTSTDGRVIISRVRRRSRNDARPFIYEQHSNGSSQGNGSRVGQLNGYASIPNITTLTDGVVITAVEIVVPFKALFNLAELGLSLYPDRIYDAAFF